MEAVPATDLETLLAETDWLARLASSLTGDPHGAEDLAQETWLAALRRPPERAASIRPWLATVARNAARLDRRSAGARRERESARVLDGPDDVALAPEELLARAESQEELSRLVRELPPELSEVVLLTFHEGRTSAWIARQRGIPAATVRARKQRALELLRERLDTRHDGDRQAWLAALAPLAATAGRRAVGTVASRGFLAGLLAPWFAMSLPIKLASLAALLFLALLPWIERDSQMPSAAPVLPPEAAEFASAPDAAHEPAPPAVALLDPDDRTPAPAVAAGQEAPPITRVRLRVVDPLGRPVADAEVTPSLSFALEEAHAFLQEELGPLRMLTLQAEMVRRTGADGVARWETDLLRETGLVDFEVEGPRFETGELRVELEPGMDEDLGEVVLRPAGAVSGRVRTTTGEAPGRRVIELGPVELPADEAALERLRATGPPEPVGYETTDADGRFRLTGVPPGEYRAFARPLGVGRGSWSAPLVVTAGLETEGIEVEVEPDRSRKAEILVLGADGAPLPSARVRVEGQGMIYSGKVDEQGRYGIGGTYDYFAGGRATVSDDFFEHRTKVVEPLPLEPERVVVRLEAAETVARRLRLHGPGGAPVATADVGVTARSGSRWWNEVEGAVELTVPADLEGAFDLSVRARGFAPRQVEGLTASALPDDWALELTPQPGIRGVVRSGGAPLERARVELRWQVDAGHVEVEGTEVRRVQGYTIDEVRTGEDGSFQLHGDTDGDLAVVVSRAGHADAVVLLTGYVAADGWSELEVELDAGGVVRGAAVDHLGAPLQGATVVLHHPLHPLRSTRTKRDGSFRFRRVPAGDWYLRLVDELDDGFFSRRIELPADWRFPANCAVVAGVEVVHELVLPDPAGARVAGRVRVTGADPGALAARVYTENGGAFRDDPFAEDWEARAALDGDGLYEVPLREGRDYVLRLTATGLVADLHRAVAADELPRWDEVELALATLSFTRAGAPPEVPSRAKVLVSWRDGGWSYDAWLEPGDDGLPGSILVPAGELEVAWKDADGADRTSRVSVAVGEEAQVALD